MKKYLLILLLVIGWSQAMALPKDSALISGSVPNLIAGDSIILIVWDELISERKAMNLPHRRYSCKPINDSFTLNVPASKTPAYFSLLIQNRERKTSLALPIPLVEFYLLHAGDSSHFQFDSITIKRIVKTQKSDFIDYHPAQLKKVFGSHSMLYTYKQAIVYTIDSFYRQLQRPVLPAGISPDDPKRLAIYYQTEIEPLLQLQLAALKRFQKELYPTDYDRLYADLIADSWALRYRHFRGSINSVRRNPLTEVIRKEQDKQYRDYFIHCMQLPTIPTFALSKNYYAMRYEELKMRHWVKQSKLSLDEFIYQMSDLNIHDKLVTFYLVERFEQSENPEALLTKLWTTTKDSYCKSVLSLLSAKMKGMVLTDFALKDVSGKTVKISNFKNKIVMLDFWYTGCSNCVRLYKEVIAPAEKKFIDNKEIVFVSISIDADKQSWLNSIASGMYTSADKPNVINLFTDGKGMDHPAIRQFNMPGFPFCLLVGKDGRIVSNSIEELKDLNNLITRIESLMN